MKNINEFKAFINNDSIPKYRRQRTIIAYVIETYRSNKNFSNLLFTEQYCIFTKPEDKHNVVLSGNE